MTLQVIGAGFGRTGTESMKLALDHLGFGPCHHMTEVLADPAQTALWRRVAAGNTPDWDEVFAGYNSCIDWPSAFFWRELAERYPHARVVLTLRSPESWYASFSSTILKVLNTVSSPESVGARIIGERVFGGRAGERDHAIAVFERNTADVIAAMPAERLLVYHIGDGWAPLCRFLDRPLPDMAFPRSNSGAEFHQTMARVNRGDKPQGPL